ncbi:penicillin-binding protein 2, partial [Rhizobium leguminosarum]|nr:penicillin-binding protein 2 [Rhizobium leguminosarum]
MKKSSNKNKSVAFSANPILSVRLPMWRSKLVVFLLFMAFVALTARAFWIQGPGNGFYQKQGESRYQRRLELPATRGKILDRNGLVLATSLP